MFSGLKWRWETEIMFGGQVRLYIIIKITFFVIEKNTKGLATLICLKRPRAACTLRSDQYAMPVTFMVSARTLFLMIGIQSEL